MKLKLEHADAVKGVIIFLLALALVLLVGISLSFQPGESAVKVKQGPLYKSGDGHYIVFHIKFSNACWEELYMRASPKGANHRALNSLTVYNTDPANVPQPELVYKLPFDGKKVEKYSAEKRTRAYVTAELPGQHYNTVTLYQPYSRGTAYYHFHFFIKTEPMYCSPTAGR